MYSFARSSLIHNKINRQYFERRRELAIPVRPKKNGRIFVNDNLVPWTNMNAHVRLVKVPNKDVWKTLNIDSQPNGSHSVASTEYHRLYTTIFHQMRSWQSSNLLLAGQQLLKKQRYSQPSALLTSEERQRHIDFICQIDDTLLNCVSPTQPIYYWLTRPIFLTHQSNNDSLGGFLCYSHATLFVPAIRTRSSSDVLSFQQQQETKKQQSIYSSTSNDQMVGCHSG